MKIVCISDLHGHLPTLTGGDMLVIAGDICPFGNYLSQAQWLNTTFNKWLSKECKSFTHKVLVWGNHDIIGQVPEFISLDVLEQIYVLTNKHINLESLDIFGSPHTLPWGETCNWPFVSDNEKLERLYSCLPKMDIVISHGPPYRLKDWAWRLNLGGEYTGAIAFRNYIDRHCPKLVVFGHIHECYGMCMYKSSLIVNASHCTRGMLAINPPIDVYL